MKLLLTEHFMLLNYLYEIKNNQNVAHCTQVELAEKLFMCRATANKLIKELRDNKFLKPDDGHMARYELTKKAIKVVEAIRAINV